MLLYQYTRAMALSDGVLVDVSKVAKEAGFKVPVAITAAVHALISETTNANGGIWNILTQDSEGRLWDVLKMAYFCARMSRGEPALLYKLVLPHYEVVTDVNGKQKKVLKTNSTLKMVTCGGDNGEQVITIMLPDED
mgnify:CR=1 FL=1